VYIYTGFSPVLGLLGNVHGKVTEGDLHVQDSRHGVGYQEIADPRPGALPRVAVERKDVPETDVKEGGR